MSAKEYWAANPKKKRDRYYGDYRDAEKRQVVQPCTCFGTAILQVDKTIAKL